MNNPGFLVDQHLFKQRPADPHSHSAVDLAFRQLRVQDPAGIVHIDDPVNGHLTHRNIHGDIDKSTAEGRRVGLCFMRGFSRKLTTDLLMIKTVHCHFRDGGDNHVRLRLKHHIAVENGHIKRGLVCHQRGMIEDFLPQ